MSEQAQQATNDFIVTKEYRRFAEFCDACRQSRYIGLCYGPPGVGKSFSAWHYAQWDLIAAHFSERFYDTFRLSYIEGAIVSTVATTAAQLSPALRHCRSVLYTPAVTNTPKRVEQEVRAVRLALAYL